jgi:acetyl esterase/lipase
MHQTRSTSATIRRLAVALMTLAVLSTAACYPRSTSEIVLAEQRSERREGSTWQLDFHRNPAYSCGLSGAYSFLVINPRNAPTDQAPLWVFLHGGGVGYFSESGQYEATGGGRAEAHNVEESFTRLTQAVLGKVVDRNGNPVDSTLRRRLREGYRVLAVSLCDHDLYSGVGGPYPNNPGATVDGHLATLAAVDHVTASYPTTEVYAHGTSAGAVGAFSLAATLADEGRPLDGAIVDSMLLSPRLVATIEAQRGATNSPFGSGFEIAEVTRKIGPLVDPGGTTSPEARISAGLRSTPILFVGGNRDPFCGGNQPTIAAATAEGFDNNCDWSYQGLREAVAAQADSPHRIELIDGRGHVLTHSPFGADIVDDYLDGLPTN